MARRSEAEVWREAARLTRGFAMTVAHRGRPLADDVEVKRHEALAEELRALAKLFDAEAVRLPLGADDKTPVDGISLMWAKTPLAFPGIEPPPLPPSVRKKPPRGT